MINYDDKSVYKCVFNRDEFMRLFLSDICLRPSCYECQFKQFPRVSDITLGDCWGVEKHSPEMDDNKGTSVVVINTGKGEKVRNSILSRCTWKMTELNAVLPENADSRKSVLAHKNRAQFFDILKIGGGISSLLKTIEPSIFDRIKNKIRRVKESIIS